MYKKFVVLHKEREKSVKNRHPWIFSGAIKSLPDFENGEILSVYSSTKEFLGHGYFNKRCSIIGRMLNFDDSSPDQALSLNIKKAIMLREQLFSPIVTNAYRLINGEGDCLPGLVIDKYDDVLVVQISTLGMEKKKDFVISELVKFLEPRSIYEKSTINSRREEGLKNVEGFLYGEEVSEVEIKENSLRFVVNLFGQKTGFFLDQREMRNLIRKFSKGKRVLNCFSYTGGFSIYALDGGAEQVDSIDSSKIVLEEAKKNFSLNNFNVDANNFKAADVFEFLREKELNYDLMILDPPAFAKKKTDVVSACRGYKEINRLAISKLPASSMLLTCSCSYHIDEKLFSQIIFQAACEAKRNVKILQKHNLALDHPINIYCPEGSYLKSLLLYID